MTPKPLCCRICFEGYLVPSPGVSRMMPGKGAVPRPVPDHILIPTCTNCGERAIDGHVSDAIAAAWADEDQAEALLAGFCARCGIVRVARPDEQGACPCLLVSRWGHAEDCRKVQSAGSPIGIPCDHGLDVCPTCDPCTCGASAAARP